jgi:hypothetical protein
MKLNEIAKTINSRKGKRDDDPWQRLLMAQLASLTTSRITGHPGSKRGYIHPVRGVGNTARAVTSSRRRQPWRSNRIHGQHHL